MATVEQRMVFRHLLRQHRQAANISQRELGRRVGVSSTTASSWERGVTAPGREHCAAIERELGLDPDELAVHLGYVIGDGSPPITPEAALEIDPHISDDMKQVLLAALAVVRRLQT